MANDTDGTVGELLAAARALRETANRVPTDMEGKGGDYYASRFREDDLHPGDLAWIALVHPGNADPLADWLEEEARQYELPPCNDPSGVCNRCEWDPSALAALAVALTINGGEPGA